METCNRCGRDQSALAYCVGDDDPSVCHRYESDFTPTLRALNG